MAREVKESPNFEELFKIHVKLCKNGHKGICPLDLIERGQIADKKKDLPKANLEKLKQYLDG